MIYSTIYMCLVYIQKNINSHQISWCDLKFTYFSLFQSKPHVPIGYVSHCIPTIDYIVGFEPHVYWQNPLGNPLPLLPASCWKAAQCLTTGGYPCREKAEADLHTHTKLYIYTIDIVHVEYVQLILWTLYMYYVCICIYSIHMFKLRLRVQQLLWWIQPKQLKIEWGYKQLKKRQAVILQSLGSNDQTKWSLTIRSMTISSNLENVVNQTDETWTSFFSLDFPWFSPKKSQNFIAFHDLLRKGYTISFRSCPTDSNDSTRFQHSFEGASILYNII